MSLEDNRVADEDDTHYFLKEKLTHTCTHPVMWRLLPIIELSSDLQAQLQVTALIHHQLYVYMCVGVCTQLCSWS